MGPSPPFRYKESHDHAVKAVKQLEQSLITKLKKINVDESLKPCKSYAQLLGAAQELNKRISDILPENSMVLSNLDFSLTPDLDKVLKEKKEELDSKYKRLLANAGKKSSFCNCFGLFRINHIGPADAYQSLPPSSSFDID